MDEMKEILATPHPKMKNACDGAKMRKKHHGFSARELYLMALVAKERTGSLEQSAAHICSISKMTGQSIRNFWMSANQLEKDIRDMGFNGMIKVEAKRWNGH